MKPKIGMFLKIFVPIALVLVAFFVSGLTPIQATYLDRYVGGTTYIYGTLPLTPAVGIMIALVLAAITAGIMLVVMKTKIR
ncbi:MAG: hypothetical protein H3Z54_13865 [archaeon]|nr:hypothetical protein [archaeon]